MGAPVITGLKKVDDIAFFGSVERVMRLFGITILQVDINNRVPNAQGKSKLLKDHLIFSPKMLGLMKKWARTKSKVYWLTRCAISITGIIACSGACFFSLRCR